MISPENRPNVIQQIMEEKGQMYMYEPNSLTAKLLPRRFITAEGWDVIRTGSIHLEQTNEEGEPAQSGLLVFDPGRFEGIIIDSFDVGL